MPDQETTKQIPSPVKQAAVDMLNDVTARVLTLLSFAKAPSFDPANPPSNFLGEIRVAASILRGILSKYPSPASKEDLEKIAEDVEKAVDYVAVLQDASNRIASVTAKIRELPETQENVAEPIPSEIASTIEAIAVAIESASSRYPSAMSRSQDEAKQETQKLDGAGLGTIIEILDVALGRMQPGKSLDDASYQDIQKAKEALAALKGHDPLADEATKQETTEMAKEKDPAIEEACSELLAKIGDVIGSKPAETTNREAEVTKIDASPDERDVTIAEQTKTIDELKSRIAKLDKIVAMPGSSNVIMPTTQPSQPRHATSWPLDLNDEGDGKLARSA